MLILTAWIFFDFVNCLAKLLLLSLRGSVAAMSVCDVDGVTPAAGVVSDGTVGGAGSECQGYPGGILGMTLYPTRQGSCTRAHGYG